MAGPDKRRELLRKHSAQWRVHNVAMGVASFATPAAVALVAARTTGRARALTTGSAALGSAAAVAWAPDLKRRINDPASFADSTSESAGFLTYSVGTAASLAALGLGHLAGGRRRLGWFTLGATALLGAVYAVAKDTPPLAWHAVAMANGVALMR